MKNNAIEEALDSLINEEQNAERPEEENHNVEDHQVKEGAPVEEFERDLIDSDSDGKLSALLTL